MRANYLKNTSQLLLRHLQRMENKRLLLVGYEPDDLPWVLADRLPGSRCTWFHTDYATHRRLAQRWVENGRATDNLVFGAWYPSYSETSDERSEAGQGRDSVQDLPDGCHAAVVFLPKSVMHQEMLLGMVARALPAGALLLTVGENQAGTRAARKLVERWVGAVTLSDAARHCTLFGGLRRETALASRLEDWAETYMVDVGGRKLTQVSFPGVFSHGRLDPGTALLVAGLEALKDRLPTGAPTQVLDFGCGGGIVGAAVRALWPATAVDLADVNALALEAAHRTLAANGQATGPVRAIATDIYSDVPNRYNLIVSNPPFHTGKTTDLSIAREFLLESAQHLHPGGRLCIVANEFLKYEPWIEQALGNCSTVGGNASYRVYLAEKRQDA